MTARETPSMFSSRLSRRTIAKGAVAAPFLGSALLAGRRSVGAQDVTLQVGSKNFAEQFTLGYMYGQLLENAGFGFEDRTNLGDTGIAFEALVNGDIDLYPEYTGTALTFEGILGVSFEEFAAQFAATPAAATPAAADGGFSPISTAVYTYVSEQLAAQFSIILLDQTAFSNTQALAVARSYSEEQGITTISQLAEVAGDLTIVAPTDFPTRNDGLLGLQAVYNAGFADIEVNAVAPGIKYQEVEAGNADVVLAFSTDGEIADLDLVVLEDDRSLWPPYHVAPFVRQDVLDANPTIADALNPVAPLLTNEVMQRLNAAVAIDGEDPDDVARAFLEENGLISA